MPDFSTRSNAKELLDNPDVPFKDIKANMRELNTINRLLGGHSITLQGFKKLLGNRKKITVCEIGCGGGDNLFVIYNWCRNNNIEATLTGIDINPHCIQFAKNQYKKTGIHFICDDYKSVVMQQKPGIIFNSLFCHHFTNEGVKNILQWMHQNAQTGFFINDLHRHPAAYYSIKNITRFFSKSYLVKNDAPLSVLRGFTKKDWYTILNTSGLHNATIQWRWAFRYLIILKK